MLLGAIINKGSQIYIKQETIDGINYVSFDRVTNDGVTRLNEQQANKIIDMLLNPRKKQIGIQGEYTVYVDEYNLKRYYKDGKEDYEMFYLNNGTDAAMYKLFGLKSDILSDILDKFIKIEIAAGVTVMLLESSFLTVATAIQNGSLKDRISTLLHENSYQSVTLESIKNYIYESEGLTDLDKETLYNESYLSFVLDNVEESRKQYDFNERMKGINIQPYEQSEKPNTDGYYWPGTNVIHILDEHIDNEEERKMVETHEFIHVTQTATRYNYIQEALAEIMSYEFYDAPIDAYLELVKRVRVLTEIIGPEAIINASYTYDTTLFEKSIRKYLNEEEAKEFLELMSFNDYTNVNKTKENEVHTRVEELLHVMINNRYEQTNDNEEKEALEMFMTETINGNAPIRYYFNSANPNFTKKLYLSNTTNDTTIWGACNESTILSKGIPNRVQIDSVEYKPESLKQQIEKDSEKLVEFLTQKFSWIDIFYTKSPEYAPIKRSSYTFLDGGEIKKAIYDEDGKEIKSYNIKTPEQFISDLKETLKSENITSIEALKGYKDTHTTYKEFVKNTCADYNEITATIEYDDYNAYINPNETRFEKVNKEILPSYQERNKATVPNKETKYAYLKAGVSEILNYEYDGEVDYMHTMAAKKVRMLMEVLGPELVLNTIYGNGDEQFEETIKQYLYKNKDKEFLQLMTFDDWDHPERFEEVDNRVFELLWDIIYNKNKISKDKMIDSVMMNELNEKSAPDRFYLNKGNEGYYKEYTVQDKYEYVIGKANYSENEILSLGTPSDVEIYTTYYTPEQFEQALQNQEFIDFLLNKETDVYLWDKTTEKQIKYILDDDKVEECVYYDGMKETNTIDIEGFKKQCLEAISNHQTEEVSLEWLSRKKLKISWNEYQKNPFILKGSSYGSIKYYDKYSALIDRNKITFMKIADTIPSINEKFGNEEQKNTNGKSK